MFRAVEGGKVTESLGSGFALHGGSKHGAVAHSTRSVGVDVRAHTTIKSEGQCRLSPAATQGGSEIHACLHLLEVACSGGKAALEAHAHSINNADALLDEVASIHLFSNGPAIENYGLEIEGQGTGVQQASHKTGKGAYSVYVGALGGLVFSAGEGQEQRDSRERGR